jgi:lantibiotic modifying enzyme
VTKQNKKQSDVVWSPIFTDPVEVKKISDLVKYIGDLKSQQNSNSTGLYFGTAGFSVFNAYLYKHYKSKKYLNLSLNQVQTSLDSLSQKKLNFSFCEGVSGICWGLFHLIDIGIVGREYREVIGDEINELLYRHASIKLKIGHYDFLYEGLGSGIYLLNQFKNKKINNQIFSLARDLENTAEKSEKGITWPYKFEADRNGYSLGLAHGVPSIIVFLSLIVKQQKSISFVNKLLEDAVKWLLGTKQPIGNFTCFATIYNYDQAYEDGRIAWCYGDISVASCIWRAGIATNNSLWKSEAISIMLHSAKKRGLKENFIVDAGFCHGCIGIAHIFNRFYQETQIEDFKEAARYWYLATISYSKIGADNAGFQAYRKDKEEGVYWEKTVGLLDGTTGIGLALLASISNIEPKWDRAFLLS